MFRKLTAGSLKMMAMEKEVPFDDGKFCVHLGFQGWFPTMTLLYSARLSSQHDSQLPMGTKNIRRPSNILSMKLVGCQVDRVYHEASPFGWVFTPPLLGFGAMNEFRLILNIWIWCLEIRDSSNPPKISEKYQTNTNLIGKQPFYEIQTSVIWDLQQKTWQWTELLPLQQVCFFQWWPQKAAQQVQLARRHGNHGIPWVPWIYMDLHPTCQDAKWRFRMGFFLC